MNFILSNPPRKFVTGINKDMFHIDMAQIDLEPNEQVTFISKGGVEYDVVKREWGFYATPSMNARLLRFNLRSVLVKTIGDKFFVALVEKGKEELFESSLEKEKSKIVTWLDTDEVLFHLEKKLNS